MVVDVVDGLHQQSLPTLILPFEQVELNSIVTADVGEQHTGLAIAEAVAPDAVESGNRLVHNGYRRRRGRDKPHLARVGIEWHILPEAVAAHIHCHHARNGVFVAQSLGAHFGEHHHSIAHIVAFGEQMSEGTGVHD